MSLEEGREDVARGEAVVERVLDVWADVRGYAGGMGTHETLPGRPPDLSLRRGTSGVCMCVLNTKVEHTNSVVGSQQLLEPFLEKGRMVPNPLQSLVDVQCDDRQGGWSLPLGNFFLKIGRVHSVLGGKGDS